MNHRFSDQVVQRSGAAFDLDVGVVKHWAPAFQDRVGVLLAALGVRIGEHRKVIDVPANRDFEEPADPTSDVVLLPIICQRCGW
jgi:hypothetical protein